MSSLFLHIIKLIRAFRLKPETVTFCRPDVRKTTKRTGYGRNGEKHVELCLDASQSFLNLALFSVEMCFRTNFTFLGSFFLFVFFP